MISVCVHTSPSGWNSGGCSTPFIAATSGRMSASRPEASNSSNPRRAPPSVRIRTSSSRMRSGETRRICACSFWMAAIVAGSISNPKRAAKRTARSMRKWSSSKALLRIADGANDARLQIGEATDIIDHLDTRNPGMASAGIQQQSVDGEIAAQHILLRVRFKHYSSGMPAVGVGMIAAKRGDLHAIHQHHAELRAHELRPAGIAASRSVRTGIGCRYHSPSVRAPGSGRERSRRPAKPGSRVIAGPPRSRLPCPAA